MTQSTVSDQPAVRFEQVKKQFNDQGESGAGLNGLTVAAPRKKIVTIVGPSGSGKSTLLSLCNLLLTPDSGEVYVEEREVRQWRVQDLRRHVGLAFQAPTMFPGTVLDNLAYGLTLQGRSLERPDQHMTRIGLSSELLARRADDLSGGQKQRVALARVLATQPNVLLLDEVTSALDPAAAREVEELMVEVQRTEGMTLLWVTHNLDQARRVGDFTWLLADGRLVEASATESFFEHPERELTRQFLRGQLGGGKS